MSAFSFLQKIGRSLGAPAAVPAPAVPAAPAAVPAPDGDAAALRRAAESGAIRRALGGDANIRTIEPIALTRLRVELVDGQAVDRAALDRAGVAAVAVVAAGVLHLIVGLAADRVEAAA
ncbi:PTS transporter subunit EIIB [Azospirillum sp. ST 5-10]|uniref:PTS transporter subunit EIIB n=1 Tax=unclassified Azospirillum TaxID=2630922 RepID=UPI003F4A5144